MPNHTFNFPMIGGDSKSRVVCPHCHVHEHVGAHTHICSCLHNIFTLAHNTLKNEILSSPMGVRVGKYKINPQSSKIDRRKEKKRYFSDVDNGYIFTIILDLLDLLQWDPNRVCIPDKPSLPRTKFASITSNEPTLGLDLITQYISNITYMFMLWSYTQIEDYVYSGYFKK